MEEICLDCLLQLLYGSLVRTTGFMDFLVAFSEGLNLHESALIMLNKKDSDADFMWVEGAQPAKFVTREKADTLRDALSLCRQQTLVGKLIVIEQPAIPSTDPVVAGNTCLASLFNGHYAVATVLIDNENWTGWMYLLRDRRQSPFSFEECLLVQKTVPHIQQALGLYITKLAQDKQHFLTELLIEKMSLPIILLDERGKVCQCNKQAEIFLNRYSSLQEFTKVKDWIKVKQDPKIKSAITHCLCKKLSHVLLLSRKGCAQVVLTFVPIFAENNVDIAGVAVLIYDQEKQVIDRKILSELYNLSVKEALICSELIKGLSLAQIAEVTYLSYETVRTYLKHVMKKTATNRQSELVAKVLTGPACQLINKK